MMAMIWKVYLGMIQTHWKGPQRCNLICYEPMTMQKKLETISTIALRSYLVAAAAAASATTAISKGNCKSKNSNCYSSFPIPTVYHQASASPKVLSDHFSVSVPRRTLIINGTMMLGFSLSDHSQNAYAAARRPPAPPPEEKKDPNVSGVQAKVLASKKRKEALKQTVAKLREKGNPVNQPPQ